LAAAAEPVRGPHWLRWLGRQAAAAPARAPRLAAVLLLAAIVRPYLGFRERMRDLADRYLLALRRRLLALSALDGRPEPWDCGYAAGAFIVGADPDTLRFGEAKPAFLVGDVPLDDALTSNVAGLRGLAVSAGVAEGRAVWVDRPEDLERFRPGDVLCAEYLDPSLSLALEHAAAAVFLYGGALSHGAIVAREYGVPAIVSVAGLRRAVVEGALVRVDGISGTITVLE
jgi:phosphohistidine swiveling domain-containing protein